MTQEAAAKEWEEFDNLLYHKWRYRGDFTIQGISKASREAYQSALTKAIEERKAQLIAERDINIKGGDWHTACENRLRELEIVSGFIKTVTPNTK